MRLTGSRATGTIDRFSDWDHLVDAEEDFAEIRRRVDAAAIWTLARRGPLVIATLIDDEGVLWDFTGAADSFVGSWEALSALQSDPQVGTYWVVTFKHLKAIHRGYLVFLDVGIEFTTGLARDIYLGRKHGVGHYKDFHAFAPHAERLRADELLPRVTGMPYVTLEQKLAKIEALNQLVLGVTPEVGKDPGGAFARQRALLEGE